MAIPVKVNFPAVGGNERAFSLARYEWGQPAGDVWYVHSDGSNSNTGRSPQNPFATIVKAISVATAANDDVICVLPGHTETLTAAGTVTVDKAGLTIIGLGQSPRDHVINYTTAVGASFDVTAARCTLINLAFTPIGFDAITAAINVSAADFRMLNCQMEHANVTNQATLGVLTTAAANRMLIKGCHFFGSADVGTAAAIRIVGGTGAVIEDNTITGSYALTGNIENITTAAVMLIIRRNHLLNRAADADNKVINVHASTTGLVVHNSGGIIDSTAPAPVTAAAMHVGGNHFSTAAGVAASVLM